ncbi:hypothetical protein BRC93_08555 [Halobacteriales archaeon QS_5_70_15]|nr:MAG: hypothetical protein BRC93_08555 [Halobacteriales archaeon QS_5_70_15]
MRNPSGDRSRLGATEVLGFVLVFSLVASTTGIVYVYGFGGLQDARDATALDNAERAMDVFADNVRDIHHRGVPNRATEIKLYDAGLALEESTAWQVNVTADGSTNTYSYDVEPLVYAGDDTELVYSNGALIRADRDSAVMHREPPFVFRRTDGENVTVVPLIETRSSTTQNVAGDSTVLVRTELAISGTTVERVGDYSTTSDLSVNLTVETTPERAVVWERYLDAEIAEAYPVSDTDAPCDIVGDSTTVACEFEVQRIYVSVSRIDVSIAA